MAQGSARLFLTRTMAAGVGLATAVAVTLTAAPAAQATNPSTFDITVTAGGLPVEDAIVTATKSDLPGYAARTDSSGNASILAGSNLWTITAAKQGYATQTTTANGTTGANVSLTLTPSSSNFRSSPVYGAQGSAVVAGGTGEFYASTSVIPQVFRTIDYGGTWTPVNVGFDDSSKGLPSSNTVGDIVASGWPGEVAVVLGNSVRYSKDFGNTWDQVTPVGGEPQFGGGNGMRIWWGHQASTSTLLARSSNDQTYVADMTQGSPQFAAKSFGASAGSLIQVGRGPFSPWVAVGSGSTINLYPLTTGGLPSPITITASGTVDCLAIGGAPSFGPGNPNYPPTVLFYSTAGSPGSASIRFQSGGTYGSATSHTETGGGANAACSSNARADVASASDASQARLHIGGYHTKYDGTVLVADATGPDGAYSAGYSFLPSDNTLSSADNVFIHTQGDVGFAKSTAFKAAGLAGADQSPASVPYTLGPNNASGTYAYNVYDNAGAGKAQNSAGGSVNGINVAVTKDIAAYAGGGTSKASVILSMSGGGRGLATVDDGATMVTAVKKGGTATAFWDNGSGDWLVYGHPDGSGIQYTLIKDWAPGDTPRANGSQNNTIRAGVDPAMQTTDQQPTGIAGIPRTNKMLGTTAGSTTGGILRATLAGSKGTESSTGVSSTPFSSKANALAYCPTGGAVNSLDDTAFVALGNDNGSGAGIKRISNAASGDLSLGTDVTGIPSGKGAVVDIDVNCDTGVIAAVGRDGVFLSQDAGSTWLDINITGGGGNFTAIAVQKAGAASVADTKIVAARGPEGYTFQSANGGTDWITVNDPMNPTGGGRNFTSEGISALEFPGNHAASVAGGAGIRRAGLTAAAAPSVTANSLDSDASLAGSGSGTATLRSSATGASSGGIRAGGGGTGTGGGSTPPVTPGKASQSVAVSSSLKIKKGKPKALPGTTNRGLAVTWKSSKPKVCKVKGAKVTGAKKGSCVLTATAPGSATVNPLTQTVSVKVS